METEEYRKMYSIEENHWWFSAKRSLVLSSLRHLPKGSKVLEVGCGTGIALERLSRKFDAFGIDYEPEAISFCKSRGLGNVSIASVSKLPFKRESFDAITCLDVLYHKGIKDDVAAMKEIFRVLKPNGILIITDSACKLMYGRHDRAVHARERYSLNEMVSKLKSAGFRIRKASYWNMFLFPIVFFARKLDSILYKNKAPESTTGNVIAPLNYLLKSLLLFENLLINYFSLPFGVSVFVVSIKHTGKHSD